MQRTPNRHRGFSASCERQKEKGNLDDLRTWEDMFGMLLLKENSGNCREYYILLSTLPAKNKREYGDNWKQRLCIPNLSKFPVSHLSSYTQA